jgi:hypothetical protein
VVAQCGFNTHVSWERPASAGLRGTAELSTRLDQINWDFVERLGPSPLEGVHPYPAKFIGDIPRSLIETIGVPPNTVVLDPFCGSGATLVESQRLGYEAIGIDLNPIACLISRVQIGQGVDGYCGGANQHVAVVTIGSSTVRFACGTKRSTRASAACPMAKRGSSAATPPARPARRTDRRLIMCPR